MWLPTGERDWFTSANWSLGRAPTDSDLASINNGHRGDQFLPVGHFLRSRKYSLPLVRQQWNANY